MKTLKQPIRLFKEVLENYEYDAFNGWDKLDGDSNAIVIRVHCSETPVTPDRILIFIIKDNVEVIGSTDSMLENIDVYTSIHHHDGKIANLHDIFLISLFRVLIFGGIIKG